jgi:hypothetical protein
MVLFPAGKEKIHYLIINRVHRIMVFPLSGFPDGDY